jgi:short-subunit dehydrogenase
MKLAGKTVLITGASQGLGAATARAMAAQGAEVLLLARSEDKLREVASMVEGSGGRAHVYPVDLARIGGTAAVGHSADPHAVGGPGAAIVTRAVERELGR